MIVRIEVSEFRFPKISWRKGTLVSNLNAILFATGTKYARIRSMLNECRIQLESPPSKHIQPNDLEAPLVPFELL